MIVKLIILLGLISFGLIVATSTPTSKDTYKAYERYKARTAKCAYKDDRNEEEKVLSNCMSEVERAWKDDRV